MAYDELTKRYMGYGTMASVLAQRLAGLQARKRTADLARLGEQYLKAYQPVEKGLLTRMVL
jgi:hypothetical protein